MSATLLMLGFVTAREGEVNVVHGVARLSGCILSVEPVPCSGYSLPSVPAYFISQFVWDNSLSVCHCYAEGKTGQYIRTRAHCVHREYCMAVLWF